jgi:MATE family multidrug resistance protein
VGYYALALPLAYWLGFRRGWGLIGIWWGLALGLAVVATLLVMFIANRGPAKSTRLAKVD